MSDTDKLQHRLDELRAEFENGRKMLEEQKLKEAELRETLMRIGGAIQVLEELLQDTDDTAD